jgi:flagellar biosynthesis regulator FlbT
VIEGSETEQLVWNGMSEAGYLALRKVISERRVAIQLVNAVPYLLENCVVYDDDWVPTMLLPAKAANLEAPRRLV